MSNNDDKNQTRLNIKLHRLKLLKILERTNDEACLKPKIEFVSKYVENSHLKPKIEIIDPEPSPIVKKKLSDQLLEENYYDSSDDSHEASVDDSSDDNISVGNEDCNEFFSIHNYCDVDEDDKRNLKTAVKVDEQLFNNKINATYSDNIYRSGIPVVDVDGLTKKRRRQTGQNIKYSDELLTKSQTTIDKLSMKRKESNENERKSRGYQSELFETLKNNCSNFKTRRKVASKTSILQSAKKECDMLKCIEHNLRRKKNRYQLIKEELENRLAELNHESKSYNERCGFYR